MVLKRLMNMHIYNIDIIEIIFITVNIVLPTFLLTGSTRESKTGVREKRAGVESSRRQCKAN